METIKIKALQDVLLTRKRQLEPYSADSFEEGERALAYIDGWNDALSEIQGTLEILEKLEEVSNGNNEN